MAKHAWMAESADEYKSLNLSQKKVALWEDGLRTNGEKGSYEWWYFGGKLDDGSSLVITFYTGPIASFSAGFRPYTAFELTDPNGKCYKSRVEEPIEKCSFSRKQCEVRIGECTFCGDLQKYEIYWKDNKIEATIHLTGKVTS